MADQDFPLMPVTAGGPQAPVETPTTAASPRPQSEGGFATATGAAYRQSPVVTEMMRGYGDIRYGDQTIPHDKAADVVKAQGLDPAFIPKEGIGYGALQEEINRQGDLKIRQMEMQRSGGGPSFGVGVAAGVAAGLADPSNLVLGPVAGRIAGLARGAMAVRAAAGAGIAATYQFGMEAGQAHVTGHDEDIGSWTMLRDATFAAGFGGVTGAAFGPRPLPPGDMSAHLGMISYAENSAGYAKAHNIPVNEVTSRTGAIGEYQIEPATAKQYGFDPTRLKDPAYNKEVATAILRDLDKKFNGDPEAIAVAWNAGPGRARAWLKAGKDMSVLPTETQNYLKRIMSRDGAETFGQRGVGADPNERAQAAREATTQFAADKPVDGGPILSSFGAAKSLDMTAKADSLNLPSDKSATNPAPYIPASAKPMVDQITSQLPQAGASTNPTADTYRAQVDAARAALPASAQEHFDAAIKVAEASHIEGTGLTHDDMTKAIQSAFNCAMRKGVNLAAE